MIPAQIDFPCHRNGTYGEQFTIVDGASPLDLNNISFQMQVRTYPTGPILFTLDTTSNIGQGIRIVDAKNGIVEIEIAESTLRDAYNRLSVNQRGTKAVTASHDIRVTFADGINQPWAEGVLSIEPGVTNNV